MTPEAFIAKHGPEWVAFLNTPLGINFLSLVEMNHPCRSIPSGIDKGNLLLAGAPVYLNQIAGYEALAEMIRSLGREPKKKNELPPESFSEEEQI